MESIHLSVFWPVTGSLQAILLARVSYLAVTNRSHLLGLCRRLAGYHKMMFKLQPANSAEKLVADQVCQQHLQMAHLYLSLLCGLTLLALLGVQLEVLSNAVGWMSAAMVWGVVVVFAMSLLHVLRPALLTASRLEAVYLALMVLSAVALSPWFTPRDHLFRVWVCVLGLVRLPAVCMAPEPFTVALCCLGPFAVVVGRAVLEGAPLATITISISAELCGFFVTLVSAVSLQAAVREFQLSTAFPSQSFFVPHPNTYLKISKLADSLRVVKCVLKCGPKGFTGFKGYVLGEFSRAHI